MSPIGVVASFDDDGRIVIDRPLNDGDNVEQLIDYEHNDNALTLLPSDVINIDGTLYMQAMWNGGIGNVLFTQIWESTDQGATWESVSTTSNDFMGGLANLITWELGPDGYVYMMSSQFQRADDVYLTRFHPSDIGNSDAWEHYSADEDGAVSWGSACTPILEDTMNAGEMSLRYIEDHWVLNMFNAATASIQVRISEEIVRDWDEITPANVVVGGLGGWITDQNAANFTQLYGGYIAPGSTLANMDLVVSQWNTFGNSRSVTDSSAIGDQSVIQVQVTEVEDQDTQAVMDSLAGMTIIPLDDAVSD